MTTLPAKRTPAADSEVNEKAPIVRAVCLAALESLESTRQKCLFAGVVMLEAKNGTEHGKFMDWVTGIVPEISARTARSWMLAAGNVLRALNMAGSLEVDSEVMSLSEVLGSVDEIGLSDQAKEWRQLWFGFLEDKTIKDCLNLALVDGDESYRALNGKTAGGSGGDRKDFALFAARKLAHLGSHLSHWGGMDETQRTEARAVVLAAITGDSLKLRGRSDNFVFEAWPEDVCRAAFDALKGRLRK